MLLPRSSWQPGLCHRSVTALSHQESCPECPQPVLMVEAPFSAAHQGFFSPPGFSFGTGGAPNSPASPPMCREKQLSCAAVAEVAEVAAFACVTESPSLCNSSSGRARQEPLPAPAPPAPLRPPRPRDSAGMGNNIGIQPRGMGINISLQDGGQDASSILG